MWLPTSTTYFPRLPPESLPNPNVPPSQICGHYTCPAEEWNVHGPPINPPHRFGGCLSTSPPLQNQRASCISRTYSSCFQRPIRGGAPTKAYLCLHQIHHKSHKRTAHSIFLLMGLPRGFDISGGRISQSALQFTQVSPPRAIHAVWDSTDNSRYLNLESFILSRLLTTRVTAVHRREGPELPVRVKHGAQVSRLSINRTSSFTIRFH